MSWNVYNLLPLLAKLHQNENNKKSKQIYNIHKKIKGISCNMVLRNYVFLERKQTENHTSKLHSKNTDSKFPPKQTHFVP